MNLLDEHMQATNKSLELTNTLEIKKRLRQACLDELKSFTPAYKDFPVLVARAKQLQKDIKDCDEVIPQLELDLKKFECEANELYRLVEDQYELRMDYTTRNRVWTEPGTHERMMLDALNTDNMSIDEIKSRCDNIELAMYQSKKSALGTHTYLDWRYLSGHDLWNVKNALKDVIDAKRDKIVRKSRWF